MSNSYYLQFIKLLSKKKYFHCINMSKQLVLCVYAPRSENIIYAYCKCFSFESYKTKKVSLYRLNIIISSLDPLCIGHSAWNCLPLTFRQLMGPKSSSTFI